MKKQLREQSKQIKHFFINCRRKTYFCCLSYRSFLQMQFLAGVIIIFIHFLLIDSQIKAHQIKPENYLSQQTPHFLFINKKKLQDIFLFILIMKVLIVGAYGQVGQQLIRALKTVVGLQNIVGSDLKAPPASVQLKHHQYLNALDPLNLNYVVGKHQITDVYCLSALLSATGELNPMRTQQINMRSLFNCLQLAKQKKIKKLFWPSSIAAFGQNCPKDTPQQTVMDPSTVYGITKKAGQLWCSYYNKKFGVDVRSLRYPGLVGYRSPPGGGTTDYAVDIFHKAILNESYQCYLQPNTPLPMIYTDDAINGTIDLMTAPSQKLTIRTSYNMNSMTFTPNEIYTQIKKHKPNFQITYKINPLKQAIANSWPYALNDKRARKDWGWQPKYNLQKMVKLILDNLTVESIKAMK